MLARVETRAGAASLRVGSWLVEPSLDRISDAGTVHHLEPQVMDLLVFLAHHPDRVVSKEEIIEAVWTGRFISEATLTRSVADLRRALGDRASKPTFVQTIPKRGYRLVAPVVFIAQEPSSDDGISADDEPPRILVFPFANLGPSADDQSFCDGLTEEVTNVLTRVPGLRVIGRTTAFAARSTGGDPGELAERLRISYFLEGSVRRAGDRLRVTAQLIRARDQCHVLRERYDRAATDVFAIQDEIAESIARLLRTGIARRSGQ